MNFYQTHIQGPALVELDKHEDDRGFFARAFCTDEFARNGLRTDVTQVNIAYNHTKGTLRGMHYQTSPASEPKYVRCIRGAVWDVIIDMRPDSKTYLQHLGVELSSQNRRAIYIPDQFAHGYITLTDGAELIYQLGAPYTPECERGVRYDDPAISINWPLPVSLISKKDQSWPFLILQGATYS